MKANTDARSASEIFASLRSTADAYHKGEIAYADLNRRNAVDWRDAARDPRVHAEVSRLLREVPRS